MIPALLQTRAPSLIYTCLGDTKRSKLAVSLCAPQEGEETRGDRTCLTRQAWTERKTKGGEGLPTEAPSPKLCGHGR